MMAPLHQLDIDDIKKGKQQKNDANQN